MKHFFKLTCVAAVLSAGIFTLPSFNKVKKTASNVDSHNIQLVSNRTDESRGAFE